MKLLFKERLFSWLDSYDIYDEQQEVRYRVEGKLSWGHRLVIYDARGIEVGEVKEEVFSFLPRFYMRIAGEEVGVIKKEFSFFKPKFQLECFDWQVQGDLWEWEYEVSHQGCRIMHVSKEIFHFTDTYVLDVVQEEHALYCLMIVLAIDAAKCSSQAN